VRGASARRLSLMQIRCHTRVKPNEYARGAEYTVYIDRSCNALVSRTRLCA
jgi:hypothetical protein